MYKIQSLSRRIDKQFDKVMSRFSDEEVEKIKEELQREPKGNPASHRKIRLQQLSGNTTYRKGTD